LLRFDENLKKGHGGKTMGGDAGLSVQLAAKQLSLETAEKEIESLQKEVSDYKNRLAMMAKTTNRHQEMVALTDQVEKLEASKSNLEIEIVKMSTQNNLLIQQLASMNEQLSSTKWQLDASKCAYTRDLADLKPLLEKQFHSADGSMRESEAAQKEKELIAVRLKEIEKRLVTTLGALEDTKRSNKNLTAEQTTLLAKLKGLESELGKRARINTIVVAAKLSAQDETKHCRKQMQEAEKERDTAVAEHKKMSEEKVGFEQKILKLQQVLLEAEDNQQKIKDKVIKKRQIIKEYTYTHTHTHTHTHTQYLIELATAAALELRCKDLQDEVDKFTAEGGGMSSAAQERWDARELIINHIKNDLESAKLEITKLSKENLILKKKEKTLLDENKRLAHLARIDLN